MKNYLATNHTRPFFNKKNIISAENVKYDGEITPLKSALQSLTRKAVATTEISENAFLREIAKYCEWIGYSHDCAYVFLLRDALLPYVYYQNKMRTNVHPWLLGRKSLAYLTGKPDVDDQLRAVLFKALELEKVTNYHDFCSVVLPEMRAVISQYRQAERVLLELLRTIDAKRITVVESGCWYVSNVA